METEDKDAASIYVIKIMIISQCEINTDFYIYGIKSHNEQVTVPSNERIIEARICQFFSAFVPDNVYLFWWWRWCVYTHVGRRACLCAHMFVEASTGHCGLSSSVALHLIFWDRPCHWTWSWMIQQAPGTSVSPPAPPALGLQVCTTMTSFFSWVLGIKLSASAGNILPTKSSPQSQWCLLLELKKMAL